MATLIGRKLSHFRVTSKLGEGGMGEVFLAEDTKLDREVALKVLPAEFSEIPERVARFEREAKLLAALNHPNIAGIYGFDEAAGENGEPAVHFIAMELAPGQDLARRLKQGPMPIEDVLAATRQIASGLEEAHERGVLHRDLKPSNVQLGPRGEVKLLDFGLAKALEDVSPFGAADLSHSPTLPAGTTAGMILGTAAYMSPEQARGRPLDRRTDLWAFGCVLYEMLTGRPAFRGETVTDVLAAVLSTEPDLGALPSRTPPALRRLLVRCLIKDPERRLRDAADARLEIDDATGELTQPTTSSSVDPEPRRSVAPWIVAGIASLLALAGWMVRPWNRPVDLPVPASVLEIEPLTTRVGAEFMPALSPDGRSFVYCAEDGGDLDIFLLRVGGENAINLTADHEGWDGAPEFSPDGEKIAFSSDREGFGLYVMGATGESPRRVADGGTHPSWAPDGRRLVAATEQVDDPTSRYGSSRLFVVDLDTGEEEDLAIEGDGVGPRWSPDGSRIAYWSHSDGQRDLWTIAVEGGESVRITDDAHTDWEPSWTEGGRAIVFHSDRGGNPDLWRIPIDPQTGAASGSPTPLTVGVMPAWESSLSADGSRLVVAMRKISTSLVRYPFDPTTGQVTGPPQTVLEVNTELRTPTLSPDGNAIVYRTTRPREIVTVADLSTGVRQRLTEDRHRNRQPQWSPDGQWIAMASNRSGIYQIWRMRPDGSDLHLLYDRPAGNPVWSPDGLRVAVRQRGDTFFLGTGPTPSETAEWTAVDGSIERFAPVAWSPNGRRLLGTIRTEQKWQSKIYDFEVGAVRATLDLPTGAEHPRAWLPDSERLTYWDVERRSAVIWNTTTDEKTLLPEIEGPGSILPSPDGSALYVMQDRVRGDVWMLTLAREVGSGDRRLPGE